MLPEERRKLGFSWVARLHEPGAAGLDREADLTPQARMEALWDLTLEYLAWTNPDEREPRFQRSVCRLERRAG